MKDACIGPDNSLCGSNRLNKNNEVLKDLAALVHDEPTSKKIRQLLPPPKLRVCKIRHTSYGFHNDVGP